MEYPNGYVPVVLDQRPYRNRPRLASEHHRRQPLEPLYYKDRDGFLLIPAAAGGGNVRRSTSQAGPRTAPIIINNWSDDHSPEGRSGRRGSHGSLYTSDGSDDRGHSRSRHRRSRSRGRHTSRHRHEPSPPPSPAHDPDMDRRMRRLDELEEKEKDEAARQKFEEQRIIDEAKRAKEAKELDALKHQAIEEHNAKLLEEKMKEKQKKEDEDKAFNERMRTTLIKAGFPEDSIEKTLKGKKEKAGTSTKILDLTRPTYIKVHRKHLSPDTLDLYDLPWEWDERDVNYIVIKRWIPEHDQDILFEHTRSLREGRRLTNATVEIKKERDKLLLVRKRSPSRRRSTSRGYVIART